MSTLTLVLTMLAGMLFMGTIIAIHASVVTARNKAIPRWIFAIGGACLVVATLAVWSYT